MKSLYWAKEVGGASIGLSGRRLAALAVAAVGGGVALNELCESAVGQVPQTLNGPPVQVQPYVPEPGVPLITINPGTSNPFSNIDGADPGNGPGGNTRAAENGTGADGSGTGDAMGGDYSSDANGGGGAGTATPLGRILGTSWGAAAIANAQAVGVNASAVAATCVLESGCQNIAARGGTTVSGAFQMTDTTYTSDINAALGANPSLSSQITPGLAGKMDPATEAVAAAQDLKTAAVSLLSSGISDPTVLDTRGYYNFGARYGATLAQASDDQNMSALLPTYSASQLAANGITPTTTVGQWRQSIIAKIGNAAYQSILSS